MTLPRIGWMDRYRGQASGDTIVAGGAFVEGHGYGHEIFNFQVHDGQVYGYVRPPRGAGDKLSIPRLNLNNLGAKSLDEHMDGVLVVWVSQSQKLNSNVIVG